MMNDGFILKDFHISQGLKDRLLDFLQEKTGMEWFCFKKRCFFTETLKPYFMEHVNCIEKLMISFQDFEDYELKIGFVAPCQKKIRQTFKFTKEEIETIEKKMKAYGYEVFTEFVVYILLSLVCQGNVCSVNLRTFTDYFINRKEMYNFVIPGPLLAKLENTSFKNLRTFYIKKAFFYMQFFNPPKALTVKENEKYRVTNMSTGWKHCVMYGSPDIKEFISNRNYGSTQNIAVANILDSYLEK